MSRLFGDPRIEIGSDIGVDQIRSTRKDIDAIPDVPVWTRLRLSRMCVGRCAS
jgi:hypothetical protein